MLCLVAPARAIPIAFAGSGVAGGNTVTASATFDISGDILTVTLQNTSPAGARKNSPTDTLSGLFFELTGDPTLVPVSATIPGGSSIIQATSCTPGPCGGITNVGGEWGYEHNTNERIASAGYVTTGLRKNIGNFANGAAGTNLGGPASLGGINFGLVTKNGFNPNGGLSRVPLIEDTVVLTLAGVDGLTVGDISDVFFRYGTDRRGVSISATESADFAAAATASDPLAATVDEPTPLWLLGVAVTALAWLLRRRA